MNYSHERISILDAHAMARNVHDAPPGLLMDSGWAGKLETPACERENMPFESPGRVQNRRKSLRGNRMANRKAVDRV